MNRNLLALILFLFAGALYGLVYSLGLMLFNFSEFSRAYYKIFRLYRNWIWIMEGFCLIVMLLFIIFKIYLLSSLFIMLLLCPLLFIFAKAIEELDSTLHEMDYKEDWKGWTEEFLREKKEKYYKEFPILMEIFEEFLRYANQEGFFTQK